MRYHVRNAAGEELVVPSLADLHALYAQGFLAEDDLVRRETSDRWMRCGELEGLGAGRPRAPAAKLTWLVLGLAVALAAAVGLLLAR